MKTFLASLRAILIFTLLTGVVYPLLLTGGGGAIFPKKVAGDPDLIAGKVESLEYVHPRPSASDFSTVPSGATNLAPTSQTLREAVERRRAEWGADAPAELLTASASGLDPHLSPEAARFQLLRIAERRGIKKADVPALVEEMTEPPTFGFMGQARINVVRLNRLLDERFGKPPRVK